MNEIKQFIIENKVIILAILNVFQCLLVIVMALVTKKLQGKPVKVLDTIKEYITRLLPYCICEAEKTDLKGEDKKVFALQVLYSLLKEFGYEEVYDQYRSYAMEQIEIILSTPQKKER